MVCRSADRASLVDIGWLKDFVALAEHANFSRAAKARNVTQPAFGRRIRALEEWVGVELFHRGPHGVSLTSGGEQFRQGAEDLVRRIDQLRDEAREAAGKGTTVLRFAATHALSFSFFPQWIRQVGSNPPTGPIELISDSLEACETIMLRGQAQFLLCHHHPDAESRFDPDLFTSIAVGAERLVPLVAPDAAGAPLWRLPGTKSQPVAYLGYRPESGLGRIIAARQGADRRPVVLDTVFTSHLAAALLSMARNGHGVGWLPLALATQDLAEGRLVRAADESWDIAIEIRLFRAREKLNRAAEQFWRRLSGAGSAALAG
jgi:LysR family transcriptional regulator, hypochlorite-specific transcription factor HypT